MLKWPIYACYFSVINVIIIIHRNPAPCILSTSSSSATPSVYFSSSFSHTTMQIWQAQLIISSTTLDTESVTLKILTPSWRRGKAQSLPKVEAKPGVSKTQRSWTVLWKKQLGRPKITAIEMEGNAVFLHLTGEGTENTGAGTCSKSHTESSSGATG